MTKAVEAVETIDGWYSLHDLRSIDWASWKNASQEVRDRAIKEFHALYTEWNKVETDGNGSQVMYQVVGQDADLMFMFVRPTMEELADIETTLNKTILGEFLLPTYSHLSVIDISKYRPGVEESDPYVQERLRPILPKWEHICYYRMSLKRDGDNNWYTLEKNERGKLLYEHSLTGRQYANKIKQFIAGSIGYDKWEWAVTLFAHDPLEFKKIVYEMRFDTATSRYGEFDKFFVGNYLSSEAFNDLLKI